MRQTFDDVFRFTSSGVASRNERDASAAGFSRRAKNSRGHNWRRFYAREDRKTGLRVWLSFFIYTRFFYIRHAFAAYAARCSPRVSNETVMRFARNSKAKIILRNDLSYIL